MLDENKHQTRQLPHQGLYLEEIWNFQDSGQKYSEKKKSSNFLGIYNTQTERKHLSF